MRKSCCNNFESESSIRMATQTPTLVAFGETMVRYCPTNADADDQSKSPPSCAANYLRTIAGCELNLCVNYSRLGDQRTSSWVSSLPATPHPIVDLVLTCTNNTTVNTSHCYFNGDGEVGSFTILPTEKRVHYRRASSTFWLNQPQHYPWKKIFQGVHGTNGAWLHATGITALCGEQALKHWQEHLQSAVDMHIPVSIDINHRAALGTIENLWSIMQEQMITLASHLKFFVFSLKTLMQVSALCGVDNIPAAPPSDALFGGQKKDTSASFTSVDDSCWLDLLRDLRTVLIEAEILSTETALGCCFKKRDANGVQTRWSAVATLDGIHTTQAIPTLHVPKEECGGGDAWSVGCIDGLIRFPTASWKDILRRGDVSAAFCQECVGDHSNTSGQTIDAFLKAYQHRPAAVGIVSIPSPTPSTNHTKKTMNATIQTMGKGKVVAILRAKNADLAIARGIELVTEMGATCIEVTTDTEDYLRVLSTLCTVLGERALVGVGTIMHAADVAKIAELGATFALSPINPPGFVVECLRLGVVPVPAASTPNEIWTAYQQGAHLVKLFPAQLWQPNVLKAMLGTGELGDIKICPSGGISPETAPDWLNAGAFCVGMGSHLTGKDVKIDRNCANYAELLGKATEHWEQVGKGNALKCLLELKGHEVKK